VGGPALARLTRLAAAALDWEQRANFTDSVMHRPAYPYGENLHTNSGNAAWPWQVVQSGAANALTYDVRSDTCRGICGPYTQIVWRATRCLAGAVATDAGREVWVCEYDPRGNLVGDRPY